MSPNLKALTLNPLNIISTMNTYTPTPETDGEWNRLAGQDHPEFERNLADFARNLECERDELAERLDFQQKLNRECIDQITDRTNERDEILAQLREEQQLHIQTLDERDEARQWESQALVARIQRDQFSKTLGEVREILCEALPNENQLTSFMAVKLARERDEARNEIIGWRNKWDCAIDMAARAENALDEMTLRWERTNDALFAERALADRLAGIIREWRDGYGGQMVDPECGCCDCKWLKPIDEALAAWKEARSYKTRKFSPQNAEL